MSFFHATTILMYHLNNPWRADLNCKLCHPIIYFTIHNTQYTSCKPKFDCSSSISHSQKSPIHQEIKKLTSYWNFWRDSVLDLSQQLVHLPSHTCFQQGPLAPTSKQQTNKKRIVANDNMKFFMQTGVENRENWSPKKNILMLKKFSQKAIKDHDEIVYINMRAEYNPKICFSF